MTRVFLKTFRFGFRKPLTPYFDLSKPLKLIT
eukprot:UN14395